MSSTKDSMKVVSNLFGLITKEVYGEGLSFFFFIPPHLLISVMEKLNFRVGEELPNLIGNIAQEKLIYKQDPEGAIKVFTDSLGMDDETALKCLSGQDYILCYDSGSDMVSLNRREDNPGNNYPILNTVFLRNRWISELMDDLNGFNEVLSIDFSVNKKVSIDIDLRLLIDIFLGRTSSAKDYMYIKIASLFEDREEDYVDCTMRIGYLIGTFFNWSVGLFNKYRTLEFLETNGLLYHDADSSKNLKTILRESVLVFNYMKRLLEELDYVSEQERYNTDVLKLYQSNPITSKLLLCNILPVSIEDGYDAGWLSPEGDFYGMNGEIADMLHNQISDLLFLDGIIPQDRDYAKDTWLETHGWVKIHGSWILFDCEEYSLDTMTRKVTRYLTKEQVESIYRYGQICHNGLLKFGYSQRPISVVLFRTMDDVSRSNLFKIS